MDISEHKEIEEMKRSTKKCGDDDTISNNNNKLEDLPEHLIHEIMHLLPYVEAAKFSELPEPFNSYWLSFPDLSFNYESTSSSKDSYDNFFNSVQETLKLRGPHIQGSLQKLSLSYIEMHKFSSHQLPEVFDMLLKFAVENNVKEMNFHIKEPDHSDSNVNYDSLHRLFSSKFLTVLKLTGVKVLWVDDVFIKCPKLTELVLDSCDGIRSLNVTSSSLKQVEVKCCTGLTAFHISEGKSLQSFKFKGFRTNDELLPQCNIRLPTCDFLKYLHLTNVRVSEDIYNNGAPQVEFLYLDRCDMPKNLSLHNPYIKVLEMNSNYKLENIVLSTPNLECFMYKTSESEALKCSLDISGCLALRVLKLINATTITDEWLNPTVQGLSYLEELEICNCNLFENMKFVNYSLKKLSLSECLELKEVHVHVPNLLEFYYSGEMWSPISISSCKCNLNISLPFGISDISLMDRFLSNFKYLEDLSLSCFRFECMIIPKRQLSPRYDLRHVKLEASDEPPRGQTLIRLLKSLFRLAPKLRTITLYSQSTKTMSTLKFKYGKKVDVGNSWKVGECCRNALIKCWRHYEKEIEFQGFESERENLIEFFTHKLRDYVIY